jgi:hypothetical protein
MAAHYHDKNNDWFLSFQAKYDAATLQGINHDTLEKILNAPAVFKSQIIPMYQLLKQDLFLPQLGRY